VLLAISTSGNSPNVLAAIDAARELGMATLALTGGTAGAWPSNSVARILRFGRGATATARIQETHILIIHCLCDLRGLAVVWKGAIMKARG
jgi:phosphoheptose isomerase